MVQLVPRADGEAILVAWVVPENGAEGDVVTLRSHLAERLPAFMIPRAFVPIATLPRTSHGKLDRRSLPMPGDDALGARDETRPRDAVEERLAALWAEVLGLERVGIHESFFDLGGHSLLAAQLIARIRRQLDVELPLRSLFESPTVAGLAQEIAGLAPAAPEAPRRPPLVAAPRAAHRRLREEIGPRGSE